MAVQIHGGEIWARNNSEKGATFTFILPISQKERI
jgi:signal transduction histidine kinase